MSNLSKLKTTKDFEKVVRYLEGEVSEHYIKVSSKLWKLLLEDRFITLDKLEQLHSLGLKVNFISKGTMILEKI